MADQVLDTRKAFQPGSGYFGWMLTPDVKIVIGDDDMNQREKVLDALTHMLTKQVELERAEEMAEVSRQQRQDAESEFVRVMKAVYGQRAGDGVVYKGRRYYVNDGVLASCAMTAEVLG